MFSARVGDPQTQCPTYRDRYYIKMMEFVLKNLTTEAKKDQSLGSVSFQLPNCSFAHNVFVVKDEGLAVCQKNRCSEIETVCVRTYM